MDKSLDLSVIAPVFNEKENLEAFIASVKQAMSANTWSWELILVDDGSEDGSPELLKSFSSENSNIRCCLLYTSPSPRD